MLSTARTRTLLVEFTNQELQVLERSLSPTSSFVPDHIPAPSNDLCLIIGSALLSEGPISLTEGDVWILRERVDLWTQIGSTPVGLTVKKKLYSLLLEFSSSEELKDIPIQESYIGPPSSEIKEKLKQIGPDV